MLIAGERGDVVRGSDFNLTLDDVIKFYAVFEARQADRSNGSAGVDGRCLLPVGAC